MSLSRALGSCYFHGGVISVKDLRVSNKSVSIHAKLMVLFATPLNAVSDDLPWLDHVQKYQRLLTEDIQRHDSRITVHVSATDLNNMVITLTTPDEGMTQEQVMATISKAFMD